MDTGHSQANYLNTNHLSIVCQNETACGKKATSLNQALLFDIFFFGITIHIIETI